MHLTNDINNNQVMASTIQRSLTSVASVDLRVKSAEATRERLLQTFKDTWNLHESLYRHCVTEKGHYARADPLRHPLIFYLGHTAVFYINKLVLAKILSFKERVDPKIESLCAIGVDEMSWDDLLSNDYKWPSVTELLNYREKTRNLIEKVIKERIPLEDGAYIDWNHPGWNILMGIEHERIHLETSSVLIRQLSLEYINPLEKIPKDSIWLQHCKDWKKALADCETLDQYGFKSVPSGEVNYGRILPSRERLSEKEGPETGRRLHVYGWDNEFGHQVEKIESFSLGESLISNAQFYEFVQASGYERREFWSDEGWRWVNFTKAKFPKFWSRSNGNFVLRLMIQETDSMPWDWPVEVNCLEANAFCRWHSKQSNDGSHYRLFSEGEYQRFYDHCVQVQKGNVNNTASAAGEESSSIFNTPVKPRGNIQLAYYASSSPVKKFKDADSGFYDISGNVWQWTRTPMYPFDGFEVHPHYDDFTQPCFDDKHNLFKGGSWISTGNEASPYSRYAFRRHFFQHAGFRLVKEQPKSTDTPAIIEDYEPMNQANQVAQLNASATSPVGSNPYETDQLISQYCEFHYGPLPTFFRNGQVENFAAVVGRIGEIVIRKSAFWGKGGLRALDLGCAVGRTSFELARTFDQVLGIDFSARFIQVGFRLLQGGVSKKLRYSVPLEGEIEIQREINLETLLNLEKGSERSDLHLANQLFGSDEISKLFKQGHACTLDELVKRINFAQGDACNLSDRDDRYYNFNLVLAANLIDRLYDPMAFLGQIHERIVPGGYLVIFSPYTWLQDYTPKESWIGGKKVDGENRSTKDGLELALSPWFELVKLSELGVKVNSSGLVGIDETSFHVPMVIRETERKHQFTYSQCTIWRKRK